MKKRRGDKLRSDLEGANFKDTSANDVIIVGSGPAGCAAAAMCRKAGLQVVIITQEAGLEEGNTFSQEPLESTHPGVSSLLEKLSASGAEHVAACATYSGIYAGATYTPLGEDEGGAWKGLHINRRLFNAELLRKIADQGVAIRANETVEDFILKEGRIVGIQTVSGDLYAKCIIDASGKKAIAGKKLNFKRKFFSPPLMCWTGVSGGIDRFPFDPEAAHFIPGDQGWSWLAPQPPHHCAWTRLSMKGDKSLSPPDELRDFPVIGKIQFANMRWRMYSPVCREGVVLCGDAAGILDPAAGQGIFNALRSGIVAANTVVSCLQHPDVEAFNLATYNNWFVQQFEQKVEQLKQYYAEHGLTM